MTSPGAWVLAIDFGTTNTVAAICDVRDVRTLTIDGTPVMPSAVLLAEDQGAGSDWMVGDAALRFARRRLGWFEATPKRAIADRTLFLGGRDVPVTDAIAALLSVITKEAARQHGGRPPMAFIVTHPATWAESRIRVLQDAARAATAGMGGWPEPYPLTEPEAAAQRTLDIQGVPPQARLVVLDLGGGTVDVTVVDRDGDKLNVAGRPTGLDSLGGEDFDLRLARWMTAEVGAPELFDRLTNSNDPDERERAVEIRRHARAVKEQLSRQPVVPAQLPKSPPELPDNTPVQVSKPNLEELVRGGPDREPGLAEAVGLVADALQSAPAGPPFAGVFLVGGSSRIPLLGALLTERIGKVPLTHGDPTTAVADGAARFAWAAMEAGQVLGKHPTEQPPGSDGIGGGGGPSPAGATGPPLAGASEPPPPLHGGPGGPGGVDQPPSGPAPPPKPGKSWRVAVLVAALALVLLGGGIVAVAANPDADPPIYYCSDGTAVEYSFECSDDPTTSYETSYETTEPIYEPFVGTVLVGDGYDAYVFAEPSTHSTVIAELTHGTSVEILCTVQGEVVISPLTGYSSSLWNGTPDGFIPDVNVDTGTFQATMPSC